MRRIRSLTALVGTLLALLAVPVSAQAFPPYSAATPSGAYAGNGQGLDINNSNVMVGTATGLAGEFYPTAYAPFEWNPATGDPVLSDPLAEGNNFVNGEAFDINDDGDVIGENSYSSHSCHSWSIVGGVSHDLNLNEADRVNDTGVVVGGTLDPATCEMVHGWYSFNGGATRKTLGDGLVWINNSNVAVGSDSSNRGAYWTISSSAPAIKTLIPVPAGVGYLRPELINDGGLIVGYTETGTTVTGWFTYRIGDPATTPLDLPTSDALIGLNNLDDMLYRDIPGGSHDVLLNLDTGYQLYGSASTVLGSGLPATEYVQLTGLNDSDVLAGLVGQTTGGFLPAEFLPNPVRIPAGPLVIPRRGTIPDDAPIPLTVEWSEKAATGVPILRNLLEQSVDGGKTWQQLKLAKPTEKQATESFTSGQAYQLRVSAIDDLNNQTPWPDPTNATPILFDDADKAFTYSGSWSKLADKSAVDGSLAVTGAAGDTVSYSFTGSAIGIVGRAETGLGSAELYVDGSPVAPVDFAASKTAERDVLESVSVKPGSHTVKLVANGDGKIELDGLIAIE